MRTRRRDREGELDEILHAVSRRTGLDLTGCHRDRMVGTVREAWLDAGAPRPDVYEALVDGTDTWARLVDRLTIGETYFFRDPHQLEAVIAAVRTAVREEGRARIWSAGCATGEEPYSVAILLEEQGLLERCEILGTDLSPHAVERARQARYSNWSLRRCDEHERSAYFEADGNQFRLRERFVEAVRFRTHNMVAAPPATGVFDVVLCRNLLMYLSPQALGDATVALRDSLRRNGRLFLGPSDPLAPTGGLERDPGGPVFAYRPVTRGRDARRPAPTAAVGAPTAVRARAGDAPLPAPPPPVTPAPVPVPRAPVEPERTANGEPAADVEAITTADIEQQVAEGDHAAARELLTRALAADPLDASLRYLGAALHLEAGEAEAAATAARAALYLDSSLAAAHFLLAQAEHRCGNRDRARRAFRNVVEALSGLPPDAVVPLTGGRTVTSLRETAAVLADRSRGGTGTLTTAAAVGAGNRGPDHRGARRAG